MSDDVIKGTGNNPYNNEISKIAKADKLAKAKAGHQTQKAKKVHKPVIKNNDPVTISAAAKERLRKIEKWKAEEIERWGSIKDGEEENISQEEKEDRVRDWFNEKGKIVPQENEIRIYMK